MTIHERLEKVTTMLGSEVMDSFTLRELQTHIRFAIVRQVMIAHRGNQCHAAHVLRIHRNTLRRMLIEMERSGWPNLRKQFRRRTQAERQIQREAKGVGAA